MARRKPVSTVEELYKYLRNREFENYKRALPGKPDTMIYIGKAEAYRNAAEKSLELFNNINQVKP